MLMLKSWVCRKQNDLSRVLRKRHCLILNLQGLDKIHSVNKLVQPILVFKYCSWMLNNHSTLYGAFNSQLKGPNDPVILICTSIFSALLCLNVSQPFIYTCMGGVAGVNRGDVDRNSGLCCVYIILKIQKRFSKHFCEVFDESYKWIWSLHGGLQFLLVAVYSCKLHTSSWVSKSDHVWFFCARSRLVFL